MPQRLQISVETPQIVCNNRVVTMLCLLIFLKQIVSNNVFNVPDVRTSATMACSGSFINSAR